LENRGAVATSEKKKRVSTQEKSDFAIATAKSVLKIGFGHCDGKIRHPRKGGGKVDLDDGVLLSSRGKSELNLKLSNSSKQSGWQLIFYLVCAKAEKEGEQGQRLCRCVIQVWHDQSAKRACILYSIPLNYK